jgi:hypothetical protein
MGFPRGFPQFASFAQLPRQPEMCDKWAKNRRRPSVVGRRQEQKTVNPVAPPGTRD